MRHDSAARSHDPDQAGDAVAQQEIAAAADDVERQPARRGVLCQLSDLLGCGDDGAQISARRQAEGVAGRKIEVGNEVEAHAASSRIT